MISYLSRYSSDKIVVLCVCMNTYFTKHHNRNKLISVYWLIEQWVCQIIKFSGEMIRRFCITNGLCFIHNLRNIWKFYFVVCTIELVCSRYWPHNDVYPHSRWWFKSIIQTTSTYSYTQYVHYILYFTMLLILYIIEYNNATLTRGLFICCLFV